MHENPRQLRVLAFYGAFGALKHIVKGATIYYHLELSFA